MIIVMPIAFCSIYAWSRQKKNDIVMALAKGLLWFELFVVLFANVCSIGHSLLYLEGSCVRMAKEAIGISLAEN